MNSAVHRLAEILMVGSVCLLANGDRPAKHLDARSEREASWLHTTMAKKACSPSSSLCPEGFWGVGGKRGAAAGKANTMTLSNSVHPLRESASRSAQELARKMDAEQTADVLLRPAAGQSPLEDTSNREAARSFSTRSDMLVPQRTNSTCASQSMGSRGAVNSGNLHRVQAGMTLQTGERLVMPGTVSLDASASEGARSVLTLAGGELQAEDIHLQTGQRIVIQGGSLTLGTKDGGWTTMTGDMEIADSWGTIRILGDTVFTGDVLHLASHIVVGDGVTVRVQGDMTLDGCEVECEQPDGQFTWIVEPGAEFRMLRTLWTGCGTAEGLLEEQGLFVNTSGARVRDCTFSENAVGLVLGPNANDCSVFHNTYRDNTVDDIIDGGRNTIWTCDGWGSVYETRPPPTDDPAPATTLLNRLRLELEDVGPDGIVYRQPGETVTASLTVSALDRPVVGCEAILGYNSDLFQDSGALSTEAPWDFELCHEHRIGSEERGEVDVALGLGLSAPQEGTSASGAVAHLDFTLRSDAEGTTKLYFRPQTDPTSLAGTRLTANSAGIPGDGTTLTPATRNSAFIVVDGTSPEVDQWSGFVLRDGEERNLFADTTAAHDETATIRLVARDESAGLVEGAPPLEICHIDTPGEVLSADYEGASSLTLDGDQWTVYAWAVPISETAANGTYTASALLEDRAGNTTVTESAPFAVRVCSAAVQIQLEAWKGSETLAVPATLCATSETGNLLEEHTFSLDVAPSGGASPGYATHTVRGLPPETEYLSVKTVFSLRRRLPVSFDASAHRSLSFTEQNRLQAGDCNGDNRINMLDYAEIRNHWYSASQSADLNGDGIVNESDYSLLRNNWYKQGDEE